MPEYLSGTESPADREFRREISLLVERINEEVDAVVVEGRKDTRALRAAGVTADIVEYSRFSAWLVTHKLVKQYKCVLILTDYDEKGREYHRELVERLEGRLTLSRDLRREFGKVLTRTGRRDIESLTNVYR